MTACAAPRHGGQDELFDTWGYLTRSSAAVMADAEAAAGGREIVKRLIMFSGGDDSTVVAHAYRHQADALVHLNTGIGVRQTREFVRRTAAAWDLPLIERQPPEGRTYRDLVLGKVQTRSRKTGQLRVISEGFPGPTSHGIMYEYLKQTQLDAIRNELIMNPYRQRLLLITGLRRPESRRRRARPPVDVEGSLIWANPMIYWDKLDLNEYRRRNPDCPRNEVAANLHKSGECLCGSYGDPEQLAEIEYWYPEAAAQIHALEAEAKAAGIVRCRWGVRLPGQRPAAGGTLCSSCDLGQDTP